MRVKNKGHWETHTYRYAHGVPLVEGEGALKVNWCEVTITDKAGEVRYHNAFITDWKITDENVAGLVATGRARWKIENENNNTLKTKGYHLEHNFGHGKKYLSSLLAAMNMLALLTHTFTAQQIGLTPLPATPVPLFYPKLRPRLATSPLLAPRGLSSTVSPPTELRHRRQNENRCCLFNVFCRA